MLIFQTIQTRFHDFFVQSAITSTKMEQLAKMPTISGLKLEPISGPSLEEGDNPKNQKKYNCKYSLRPKKKS